MTKLRRLSLAALVGAPTLGWAASIAAAPPAHPQYLHALSDLRNARANLQHKEGDAIARWDERLALEAVDRATREIKAAAIDDGKNIEDHPPVDAREPRAGRLHKAFAALEAALEDVNKEEDNAFANGLRGRAVRNIREAMTLTEAGIGEAEHGTAPAQAPGSGGSPAGKPSSPSGNVSPPAPLPPSPRGASTAGPSAPSTPQGPSDPNAAVSVSAGFDGWVCAVTAGGAAKCWLDNGSGNPPAAPQGPLASGVATVFGGGGHNWWGGAGNTYESFWCYLNKSGGVGCWGGNTNGELGDGSGHNSSTPVMVSGLSSGVKVLSVSSPGGLTNSACAVTSGGAVQCWGRNGGVLGNGVQGVQSGVPVLLMGFAGPVSSVAVGAGFACAIIQSGAVQCWGSNNVGQLGNGTNVGSMAPASVTGLSSGVTGLAIGDSYACALRTGGTVSCWGDNTYGQLGNGTNKGSSVPVGVSDLTGVTAISAAAGNTCALTAGGAVLCWGANGGGQLGNNTTTPSNLPNQVTTLTSGVTAISVGNGYACAVGPMGGVWCWGGNSRVPIHVNGFPG